MTESLTDLRSPAWPQDAATAPAVALLFHGFGSSEHDLAGLAPALGMRLPWASLRAPIELANGGAAWFEILTPGDPDPEPLATATDAVWGWVVANLDPATKVVPLGFSQGGLMVSQLLRTRPERVLAPVILGGFVQRAAQPGDPELVASRPAAFWGRGAEDRVITAAAVARTAEYLPAHTDLVERVYPGLAHAISAAELADVRAFLAEQVGAEAVETR
jgi:phospholipase/carboxylesterase